MLRIGLGEDFLFGRYVRSSLPVRLLKRQALIPRRWKRQKRDQRILANNKYYQLCTPKFPVWKLSLFWRNNTKWRELKQSSDHHSDFFWFYLLCVHVTDSFSNSEIIRAHPLFYSHSHFFHSPADAFFSLEKLFVGFSLLKTKW